MSDIDSTDFEIDNGVIRRGERAFKPPKRISRYEPFDDRLIVTVNPRNEGPPDPSFELPDPTRTAFAVDALCTHEWTVEATDLLDADDRFYQLWNHHGRPITKAEQSDMFFELAPDSGVIREFWAPTEFKLAGTTHELSGEVMDIETFGPVTVVNVEQQVVYGFDAEGRQLWRRDDGRSWVVGRDENGPILFHHGGRGPNSKFVLDPETGALTDCVFGSDDIAADVMGEPD